MDLEQLLSMIKERWTQFDDKSIVINGFAGYMRFRFIAEIEEGEIVRVLEFRDNKNSQRPFEGCEPTLLWEKE